MKENDGVDTSALNQPQANLEAKLLELLHKINSVEIKLVSDAAKEFIKLLKSDTSGGELLRIFALKSPSLSELGTAWKLREGKPGAAYVLKLIAAILSHPEGKYSPSERGKLAFSRVLDNFAKSIVEGKLEAVYKELGSKDAKRQNAALLLLASVVKRGAGMASEVEKSFNFKLPAFLALGTVDRRKRQKRSARKAFVRFAMSFLEEGKPWLIRKVLKQREMYSAVLRGLGEGTKNEEVEDEEEIVVHVLSTLRDWVLTEESTVPPGLRSVLFGSVSLERLIGISGRESGGVAAELAHNVLIMVCTDPCNGLMPEMRRRCGPFKGNTKRLLGLMKKLRALEVGNHRDLALAIVRSRPQLGSAYLEDFPYNVEDYASPAWFGAISLAAEVVSMVRKQNSFGFLNRASSFPPSFDSVEVQAVLKCISPRPLGRSVINKGLLHSDFLVKNGSLRFLLEALKLLEAFFGAINPDCSSKQEAERWQSFRQEVFNEMRSLLPDPQVLLTLLSSFTNQITSRELHSKRKMVEENLSHQHVDRRTKKLRTDADNDDTDIIIAGIDASADVSAVLNGENITVEHAQDEISAQKDFASVISELWGSNLHLEAATSVKDAEFFFLSKLLDALKIFLLTMPAALEGSFEFLMNHLSSRSAFPANHQISLLSLLVQFIKWCPRSGKPIRTPPLMYKHTQLFLNLLVFSPVDKIKVKAYNLARAAMSSTGAFDRNMHEIVAWILFLPGYTSADSSIDIEQIDVLQSLSPAVISFLCDAISTVGNNLFKYWDALRNHTNETKESNDASPNFSPLGICVLQKCMRLLNSTSGTFSLPEKSMISVYVCNTLKYLLQTQENASLLSVLIKSVVSKGLQDDTEHSAYSFCEWRPLKNLISFAESILYEKSVYASSLEEKFGPPDASFKRMLDEVRKMLDSKHHSEVPQVRKAFASTIMCTTLEGLLQNFPSVMIIAQCLRVPISFLSSVAFLEQGFLSGLLKLWPNTFWSSVHMAISGTNPQCTSNKELNLDVDFTDGSSSVAAAFSLVLRLTPFHVLLPAIIGLSVSNLSDFSKLNDLLVEKLSSCRSDHATSYLHLVLFWFHQLQSCFRIHPSDTLKQLAETCYVLVKKLLSQQSVLKSDSECLEDVGVSVSVENVVEVAETIFFHPLVRTTLTHPLTCNMGFVKEQLGGDLEVFITFSTQNVHILDLRVLDILRTTCDYLTCTSSGRHFMLKYAGYRLLLKAYNSLVQKLSLELKQKFDLCIGTEDIFPLLQSFYVLHSLAQFISPFRLVELGHWMFGVLNMNGSVRHNSNKTAALSVGFCVVSDAFRFLSAYLQQQRTKTGILRDLWEVENRNFDVNLMEEIYLQVCTLAADSNLDNAYGCVLNVINAVFENIYQQFGNLHPISCALLRMVVSTPLKLLHCCIYQTSKTKAKLLILLVEMSSLHLSQVGLMMLKRITTGSALSDEEFMLLLPVALSYLKSMSAKLDEEGFNQCAIVASFYSKMLKDGFRDWNNFVSRYSFWDSYDELIPSTIEELGTLTDNSLLGKAVQMLQEHFALNGRMKMKERLKLCSSTLSCSSLTTELLNCDGSKMELHLLRNHFIKVVAKVKLCQMLLFQKGNKIVARSIERNENLEEETCPELKSNKEGKLRMKFLGDLVGCWRCLVKKYPLIVDGSTESKTSHLVNMYRVLELFILKSVLELIADMREVLIQVQSIPFLEQLVRFSLLYRFEDPKTLRTIRLILTVLLEGNFSYTPYLRLLLAHSQFALTVHSSPKFSSSHTGVLSAPLSSILRFLASPHPIDKSKFQLNEIDWRRLEIIKLLRVLLHSSSQQIGCGPENEVVNLKELHSLLLSSYGATTSEIDLEIYYLMQEIESNNKLIAEEVAEMDFMWGPASLAIKKERTLSKGTSDAMPGIEVIDEHRKSVFRDNLPVDPNTCALTVLHFPYGRTFGCGDLSTNGILLNNLVDLYESYAPDVANVQPYDPLFILRFSIRALSQCYIEPVEFAAMGLLAVAIMSVSSPDIGVRKLGYEFIGRYKQALEKSQKKKDIMRLRLLLTYIQNGIEELWQKVPSIVALFAAESSIILLDPSHEHHATLSKHFLHSSRMNTKGVPLFDTFFQSCSVNFRTERLWILRLAYAGLNLEHDALIFVRNSTMETLLSFYACSFSDTGSKDLILQILKKSVKLHKIARHLVEQCGLFPWVSSVVSSYCAMLNDNDKDFCSRQLVDLMEVVLDAISSRNIFDWLQNHGLEQLMDLASHLYKLLVCDLKFLKENAMVADLVFQIMASTLKLSQKRKIYQPHFTLSFDGLFCIYRSFSLSDVPRTRNAEAGLKAILMTAPPVDIFRKDREELLPFLTWAVSTALNTDYRNLHEPKASGERKILCNDASYGESLVSKLLRWLVASTLLAKLSFKLGKLRDMVSEGSLSNTLQSFLEFVQEECQESNIDKFDFEEALAAILLHLQLLVGMNFSALPSVVSVLCLLLVSGSFKNSDTLLDCKTKLELLCCKVRFPVETNPAWRWSFHQQWKDLSTELSDSQKLAEHHACEKLILIISNILRKRSWNPQLLSLEDLEQSGVSDDQS